MQVVEGLLAAAIGLFVGSAVWVVSRQRATDRPLRAGGSCANPRCGVPLPSASWLPLFGFGRVRRCPVCAAAEPQGRVIFELAVAGYYALAVARFAGDHLPHVATLVFAVPLLVILLIDRWTQVVDREVVAAGFAVGIALAAVNGRYALFDAMIAALAAAGALTVAGWIASALDRSARVVAVGRRDIYLAAMVGAMVRETGVVGFLLLSVALLGLSRVVIAGGGSAAPGVGLTVGACLCVAALTMIVR
jgi:prepilin signal peptidase PulO-like enzyme (type II secretory pathway)